MSRRGMATNERMGLSMADRITRLEAKMEDIGDTVDKLEKAIYGNGQPGILSDVRVIRESVEKHHQSVYEKQHEKKADWKWIVSTAVAIMAVVVAIVATYSK